ncbi:MAG: HNH endonuclease signature motif containing protein, partial [bacterium]|nr:HNH endonuclease signature motif containing protein [bacterium]
KALRTSLVVVADYDFVANQLANPRLYDGTPLAADAFVRLALEGDILPALFDTDGQPLWLGRAVRDATDAQRIALAVRDKGCVGCGAPNSYCEPHHICNWKDGGPTDLDNLCLLCGHCHHKEIHSKRGAEITRGPRGKLTMQYPDRKPQHVPLRC